MRLERNLHVMKIQLLQNAHVFHGGFNQGFCRDTAILLEHFMVE